MEYINIFDENNNPIGEKKEKQQAHEDGNFHRTAHVWIINDKNELLLQKRSSTKKTHPNCWDISGAGHIRAGESVINGAIRELKEELGIELNKNDITFIGSVISTNKKGDIINNYFNEYYIANKEINTSELQLQEEEVSEIKWIDKDEIIERIKDNYNGITDKEGCWEYLIKYYEMS